MAERSWCRVTDCGAPLVRGALGWEVDTGHPLGRGPSCGYCTSPRPGARLLRPRRRTGTRWEEIGWDQALREIGGRLRELRRSGPEAIGLYAGAPASLHTPTLLRTLAWPLATGAPGLYSALASHGAPWLCAAELVTGFATPLQGDVGRAHYVVLLGANQAAQGWGPLQAGTTWGEDLAFARRTKGTKVVAVDPRRTPIAAEADLHLPVRAGTELWFVLGMIDAILKNDWRDTQYTDDWCAHRPELTEALAAWPVERCGEVCGVPGADIAGVALKFARAPMAVLHRSPQALHSRYGTLTAWAILVVQALTANLLRPGGTYEHPGLLDLFAFAQLLRSEGAPRVGGRPLLWLQAPGSALVAQAGGALRGLVSVHGDPVRDEPGGEALARLDLLVAMDVADTPTTRAAHYVLPLADAPELPDVRFADTPVLPWRVAGETAAAAPPPGEARGADEVLGELFRAVGPSLRSPFGAHLRLLGGRLLATDALAWARGKLEGPHFPGAGAVGPEGWDGGDIDRAGWHLAGPRLDLLPAAVAAELARLEPPGGALRLLTDAARDRALRRYDRPDVDPGVTLHPDLGFAEGSQVRVKTRTGALLARVHLDPSLRPDTVDLPRGYVAPVGQLVDPAEVDPLTGTPAWNGLPCAVEPA